MDFMPIDEPFHDVYLAYLQHNILSMKRRNLTSFEKDEELILELEVPQTNHTTDKWK